jgi:predicted RNA-binding Zn-ribbon protein involved in translation (DUF1610 family)
MKIDKPNQIADEVLKIIRSHMLDYPAHTIAENRLVYCQTTIDRIESLLGSVSLECPNCGDTGAICGPDMTFYDGQPLECGCKGHVSVDAELDPYICAEE